MSPRTPYLAIGTIVLVFSCVSFAAAGADKAETEKAAVSGNSDLELSTKEISQLKLEALQGSGTAAHRLATFYFLVQHDHHAGLYWETISAEDGDPIGMYSLGFYLKEQVHEDGSRVRAKYWLRRAAEAGDDMAADLLKDLDGAK